MIFWALSSSLHRMRVISLPARPYWLMAEGHALTLFSHHCVVGRAAFTQYNETALRTVF